jgi:protein-L-isoaspartate(D-aspartate) O-methyltransferase
VIRRVAIALGSAAVLAAELAPETLSHAVGALPAADAAPGPAVPTPEQVARRAMVEHQLVPRGIRDQRVLEAMRTVPRHEFVPEKLRGSAYEDGPLPIGHGQTISQPFVVAYMAQALELRGGERVLEVGSGSGYAAAVLSLLAASVYGIELEPELYSRSVATLARLGYRNVELRHGDGFLGWPEVAPFDAILISCSAEEIPPPLWEQLRERGRIVYPQGSAGWSQELLVVTKTATGPVVRRLEPVRFVPMRRAP